MQQTAVETLGAECKDALAIGRRSLALEKSSEANDKQVMKMLSDHDLRFVQVLLQMRLGCFAPRFIVIVKRACLASLMMFAASIIGRRAHAWRLVVRVLCRTSWMTS